MKHNGLSVKHSSSSYHISCRQDIPSTVIGTVAGIYETRSKYRREVCRTKGGKCREKEEEKEGREGLLRRTYTMSLCRRCVSAHLNYQRARGQEIGAFAIYINHVTGDRLP